jgi:hypothetical protein
MSYTNHNAIPEYELRLEVIAERALDICYGDFPMPAMSFDRVPGEMGAEI